MALTPDLTALLAGATGAGVKIAIIDSGADLSHPWFQSATCTSMRFDLQGRAAGGEMFCDDEGHGTYTAGLVHRIAPGAQLVLARALEGGSVIWRILKALDWALCQKPDIVLLPLGLPGATPVLWPALAALRQAGILIIAPIGNTGAGRFLAPGWYDCVLSVGAHDLEGAPLASSGSYNSGLTCLKPDLLALGERVEGPKPGGGTVLKSGTSVAAALLGGVACCVTEACGTALKAEAHMTAHAAALGDEDAHRARFGRLSYGTATERKAATEVSYEGDHWCHPRLRDFARADIQGGALDCILATSQGSIAQIIGEFGVGEDVEVLDAFGTARIGLGREELRRIIDARPPLILSPVDILPDLG